VTTAWNALLNGGILSAFQALAVWLALRLSPRSVLPASARYLIWWSVLAAAIALPALYLPVQDRLQLVEFHLGSPAPRAAGSTALPRAASVQRSGFRLPAPIQLPGARWLPRIQALWILTSTLLLARLLLGYFALCRKSARAADAPVHLRARFAGVGRPGVRLAGSAEINIPVAAGPHRPTILIPVRLFHQLSPGDLECIVLHEAAHLARRDDWALMLQRTLEGVFALHPVVRWIARQIDLEREIACDDRVVATTGRPRWYADCLTRTVALCGGVRPALAANMADDWLHLSRRVELLVDQSRNARTRLLTLRILAGAAVLAAAAAVVARTPELVAFAVPPAPAARMAESIAEKRPEIIMNHRTARNLGRKLVLAAAGTAAMATGTAVAPAEAQQATVQSPLKFPAIILYFDLATMPKQDQARAVASARKFLQTRASGPDLMAVCVYNGAT
jgi:beta-lactamase regulating signal transducer with metallopeptidase domain